jgi:plasmid replication initiation protein
LILYRQHGRNTLGAKKFGISLLMNRVKIEDKKRLQAEALFSGYQKQLSQKNSTMLQAYLGLRDASLFRNRYLMLKHRFFKQGLLRNLYTFLLVRVP